MAPHMETFRAQRTWIEKLFLWPRAYQTEITSELGHKVIGRGPAREVSEKVAKQKWNEELGKLRKAGV
jgi:hypothetical protein